MNEPAHPASPANIPPAAVLDTHVALDHFVFRNPAVAPVFTAIRAGQLRWLAVPAMRAEFAHMVVHSSLARWAPDGEAALRQFDALTSRVAPPASDRLLRCSDPDDQVFLDTAMAVHARWLITRDRALLKLVRRARLRGLEILTPEDWVDGQKKERAAEAAP